MLKSKDFSTTKKKIVDLAKGNLRLALMATYSLSDGNEETNYLSSPIALYDKYFEKFKNETLLFTNPLIFQSLAVVIFFGTIDRRDVNLRSALSSGFGIEWGDLWNAILELNKSEVIEISDQNLAKVSDQVLATYSFFKCFIDPDTAQLDYAHWINTFLISHYSRVANTLIDVNNTFNYEKVKELVLPHLNIISQSQNKDEEFHYRYHELFWFYKDVETLKYIKDWCNSLTVETDRKLDFLSNDKNSSRPSKYFELLINYWGYDTELLRPSIQLAIDIVVKQPSRLGEYLHYIKNRFSYQVEDFGNGFSRQKVLLETLLHEDRSVLHCEIAQGTFLRIGKTLLGWNFTGNHTSKGRTVSWANFELHISDYLLNLRRTIINGLIELFDKYMDQARWLLVKIVHPGGKVDKEIYKEETDLYSKIIETKLDNEYFPHCEFVRDLIEIFKENSLDVPRAWNEFLDSDMMRISNVIIPEIDDINTHSIIEEKLIQDFISNKTPQDQEKELIRISTFYSQLSQRLNWRAISSIRTLFKAIGRNNKEFGLKSLRMFFDDCFSFDFNGYFIEYLLNHNIYNSDDILELLRDSGGEKKIFWQLRLLIATPESQIKTHHFALLVHVFDNYEKPLTMDEFTCFAKYQKTFEEYQLANSSDTDLQKHNVITFLADILLNKRANDSSAFGHKFFENSHIYFTNQLSLLKAIFFRFKQERNDFDYKGKILGIILGYDKDFIQNSIIEGTMGIDYSSNLRVRDFVYDHIWTFEDYQEYIESIILLVYERKTMYTWINDDISALLTIRNYSEGLKERKNVFLLGFIEKHYNNVDLMIIILQHIYDYNRVGFLKYFKKVLSLNDDIQLVNNFSFDRSESYSGSRVPVIQRKIEYTDSIIKMIKTLPNSIQYLDHILSLERRIDYLKVQKKSEEISDFKEYYD